MQDNIIIEEEKYSEELYQKNIKEDEINGNS